MGRKRRDDRNAALVKAEERGVGSERRWTRQSHALCVH